MPMSGERTLLSPRNPPFCMDDELMGNVLNCIGEGRVCCKLRDDEYELLAAELSREPCCEPLRDPGPSEQ